MVRNRIAVNIIFFLNGFLYGNWTSRIPRIQELYGVNDRLMGIILLTMALGAVIAMPFSGWIILRNGSRRVSLLAVVLYCVFVPMIPFMPHWTVLMVLYLIIGVFTGMLDVAMNAQGVMVEKLYGKPIMTSFHAFFSIGMAIGSWCGAFFAGTSFSLSHHFIIAGGLSVLATIWVRYNMIRDVTTNEAKVEGSPFRLPDKALLGIGIITFCCMLAEGSMANWSVKYMESIAHSSVTLAPIALTAFATAMTLGRIVGDRVRLWLGDPWVIIWGGVLSTIGLSLALFYPYPELIIGGCFLVGFGLSSIVPVAYSIAGNTSGVAPGVGIAMVTTVGYSGFLLGPPIIGFLSEWRNLRFGLSVVAFLLLLMTILGVLYGSRRRAR